jgi:hypothetical protein
MKIPWRLRGDDNKRDTGYPEMKSGRLSGCSWPLIHYLEQISALRAEHLEPPDKSRGYFHMDQFFVLEKSRFPTLFGHVSKVFMSF